MTPLSLLPKIAAGNGYSFDALCEAILERATLGTRIAAAPGPLRAPSAPRVALAD
jgi:hypothetical protein